MKLFGGIFAIFAASAVRSCQFSSAELFKTSYIECLSHHSIAVCDMLNSTNERKLLQAALPVPDISLKNNGILTPLLQIYEYNNLDLIDIVSRYASGALSKAGVWGSSPPSTVLGNDLCIWSFQSIPPPTIDGIPSISQDDAESFWNLANSANNAFQDEIGINKHDGSVVFGGFTLGSRGTNNMINNCNIVEQNNPMHMPTFCAKIDSAANKSSINWPQAVYMFRVQPSTVSNNSALRSFLSNWLSRSHSPQVEFVNGGANSLGWGKGAGPGVYRKIVPCNSIDPAYLYPPSFTVDSLNAQKTTTLMDDAYVYWQSLCSVLPWFSVSDCSTSNLPNQPITSDSPPSCANYTRASIMCSQEYLNFGVQNSTRVPEDDKLATALRGCAQTLCTSLGGGNVVLVNY